MMRVLLHSFEAVGDLQSVLHAVMFDSLPSCFSVESWQPFRSEREYKDDQIIVVLIVCAWTRMTKRDYLVASYALALQAANAIRLVSATFTGVDSSVTTTGVWSQRYEYVYKRLAQLDAVKRVPDSIADWCDLVIHALRGLLTAKWDTIRKANPQRTSVFFSYSHRDESLRDELARHLKLLERTGIIEGWHDREIRAGDDWSREIDAHLYTADLILLLLSSDFFASDYCAEIETPVAIERHLANAARAIPIVLRPVLWQHSQLVQLQALPSDARPVTSWESTDSPFVNVCEGIIKSALAWRGQALTPKTLAERRFSSRKRIVDVALPSQVAVARSAMLVVLVRKSSSAGLSKLLAQDSTYGIEPEQVRSKSATVRFPVTPEGKSKSVSLSVLFKSPDFDPPEQRRPLTLSPDIDSQPLIFLFAAKREGVIKALVEVYENEELLAACPVSAVAAAVDTVQRKPSILASAEFEEDQDFTRSFGTDTGEMFGQVFGAPPARDPEPEAKRTEAMTAEAVSKEKELRFEELVQQAQTLRAEGHLDEAVAKVEAALREFPNRRNALVLRVQSKMEQEAAAARPRPPEPGTDAEYADIEDKMASSPSYGPEQMQPSLGFKRPIFLIAAITILLIALLLLFARR